MASKEPAPDKREVKVNKDFIKAVVTPADDSLPPLKPSVFTVSPFCYVHRLQRILTENIRKVVDNEKKLPIGWFGTLERPHTLDPTDAVFFTYDGLSANPKLRICDIVQRVGGDGFPIIDIAYRKEAVFG